MAKKNEITPEQQITGLQDELKKAVEEINSLNNTLKGKDKEIETLVLDKTSAVEELEAVKAINADLLKKVAEQDEQAEEGKLPVFKLDGKEYINTQPDGFLIPGRGVVKHEDLLKDKDLQKRLVEIGSGVVKLK